MRVKSIAVAILIGVAAASLALESPAQFGGGKRGGGRPDGAGREQRPPIQENSPEQIDDRLGLLEEDLHLSSADQRAAWQVYSDKVRALVADIGRERERGPLGGGQLNSLQQIDRAVDIARNRLTALEDIAAAANNLYSGLTPQQKAAADPRLATIVAAAASPAPDRTGRSRNQP